tara:strand:- start:25498 stop:26505 length:1008 start_codon:yes stop_codon:yes gene_type:complete
MLDIKTVKLRNEEEIIASWNDKEKIVVSVICAAYNHELYIEDAITGFLMQETDFVFEIIIHDDASTDKTVSIIKRYQNLYPNIIKPIYQTENQYSKGGFKPSVYASTFAKGLYVALCEGDDYWCMKSKLQKQYEALSNNKNIKLCVHASFRLYSANRVEIHSLNEKNRSIIPTSKFILGDGGYVATSSLFIRTSAFNNLPPWFLKEAPVGDYYIQMLTSHPYGAIYLDETMSVYRCNAIDNWSSKNLNNNEAQVRLREKLLKANILCEIELDDKKLKWSFAKSNLKHYKIFLNLISWHDFNKVPLIISLFQFKFLAITFNKLTRIILSIACFRRN